MVKVLAYVSSALFLGLLPVPPGEAKRLGFLPASTEHPEDYVSVLAGTDTADGSASSNGNTLPQVKRPWGFNDWAPQTNGAAGNWWFRRSDTAFEGMRCTHQPSPWIGDYSHFVLQPHAEEMSSTLAYSSSDAVFRPYLFNASLTTPGSTLLHIGFAFSPTNHGAAVQLSFPSGAAERRLTLQISQGRIDVAGDTVSGYTSDISGGASGSWRIYFVFKSKGAQAISPNQYQGTLEFSEDAVTAYVATSFISLEQAQLNLEQELADKSFDDVVAEGRREWRDAMGRVQATMISEEALGTFYTNLWKSMLFPRFLTEVNASGREVHRSPYTGAVECGHLVSDSGFWDAYRTVYPLQSIVFPQNYGALIAGWLNAYREAGWLPTWASPGQRGSMVGTMGDVVLADAIAKSRWGFASGFDEALAYEAIRRDAFEVEGTGTFGREGLESYIAKGYVPEQGAGSASESVSRTLNYCTADAAIARAAMLLGHEDDARVLVGRSARGIAELFDNETLFFRPRSSSGTFLEDFDPLDWGNGFTEGSAWQYRFDVPQDVHRLAELYDLSSAPSPNGTDGGASFCRVVESMLTKTEGAAFRPGSYHRVIHEMSELGAIQHDFGLYGHNNQPVHHILWEAKLAGCNDLADQYLRMVMDKLYTVDGWSGDEDNGEMASWYVLSALGLFSVAGAKDELVVGSPAVVSASVRLPGGQDLVVQTRGQAPDSVFVKSVTWTPLGGAASPVSGNTLKFTEVMRGGTLSFVLGDKPHRRSDST